MMAEQIKMCFDYYMPAGLVLYRDFLLPVLIFWFLAKVLRRLGHQLPSFPPFREWIIPQAGTICFWFGCWSYLFGHYLQLRDGEKAGINLYYFLNMVIIIQGLAVFYYFADKYNLSRLVRGIILLMVFTNQLFATSGVVCRDL